MCSIARYAPQGHPCALCIRLAGERTHGKLAEDDIKLIGPHNANPMAPQESPQQSRMHPYRETTLTGASLRKGRIYFSASDTPFFGVERLGDRPGKEPGTPVEIQAHGETVTTDKRQARGVHIGPRESFASWFRAIRAKEGETLRLTRLGERRFELEYLG